MMPEQEELRPLGVFGGTFDPVHFGHLRLAEEAHEALGLEAVRWIPAGKPALRGTPSCNARQRLEMVRLVIADNPHFVLDPAEVEAERPSFTVPTLERLRQTGVCGPQRPLVLLIGADAFAGLASWHRWECLFELAHVAVAHRPGFPVDPEHLPDSLSRIYRQRFNPGASALKEFPAGFIANFAMTQLDISATRIRNQLSKGLSVRYLMPERLIDHIQKNHLYQEK